MTHLQRKLGHKGNEQMYTNTYTCQLKLKKHSVSQQSIKLQGLLIWIFHNLFSIFSALLNWHGYWCAGAPKASLARGVSTKRLWSLNITIHWTEQVSTPSSLPSCNIQFQARAAASTATTSTSCVLRGERLRRRWPGSSTRYSSSSPESTSPGKIWVRVHPPLLSNRVSVTCQPPLTVLTASCHPDTIGQSRLASHSWALIRSSNQIAPTTEFSGLQIIQYSRSTLSDNFYLAMIEQILVICFCS